MRLNKTSYADGSVFTKEPHSFITSTASANQHPTMVFQPERQQQWEEGTRLCIVYSPLTLPGHPENLSLFGCCRLSCSGPGSECIRYYSQLNVGFTEATWIKWVTARMYLVLCNAVNRFAEWGFNVFLYTNIMSTSRNVICEAYGFWSDRCDTLMWVGVSLPWRVTDTA